MDKFLVAESQPLIPHIVLGRTIPSPSFQVMSMGVVSTDPNGISHLLFQLLYNSDPIEGSMSKRILPPFVKVNPPKLSSITLILSIKDPEENGFPISTGKIPNDNKGSCPLYSS